MSNHDQKQSPPGSGPLEKGYAEEKPNEKDLLRQLAKMKKREQLAINGYKAERDKRLALEKRLSAMVSARQTVTQSLLEAIVTFVPNQMMIFTYHEGIDLKDMKYVWFKHADPNVFLSSITKDNPTGDFLIDHVDEDLLRERVALLKGIHESNKSVEHEYSVPKVVIKNGKRVVENREKEWRNTAYMSLNRKDKVFAYVKDITSLKQANLAVKEKQMLKLALVDNLKEMVFMSTPDGYLYDFNPAASELLGYTPSELMLIKVENLYANPKQRN